MLKSRQIQPNRDSERAVDPSRRSMRTRKSIQLPEFSYSFYSSSFTSFLASIHTLCEPSSYTEAVLDPLWRQAITEELSALHRMGT